MDRTQPGLYYRVDSISGTRQILTVHPRTRLANIALSVLDEHFTEAPGGATFDHEATMDLA